MAILTDDDQNQDDNHNGCDDEVQLHVLPPHSLPELHSGLLELLGLGLQLI